ncbi:hypothetical protein D3C75_1144990 [compost metagenome]
MHRRIDIFQYVIGGFLRQQFAQHGVDLAASLHRGEAFIAFQDRLSERDEKLQCHLLLQYWALFLAKQFGHQCCRF